MSAAQTSKASEPAARDAPDHRRTQARVHRVSAADQGAGPHHGKERTRAGENILALSNIGYFDIVKPRAFGGYEYDFDVLVDLNIELAKVCASTAWVGGLLAAHQWLIASFPEQAQRDVWDSQPRCIGLRILCAGHQGRSRRTAAIR